MVLFVREILILTCITITTTVCSAARVTNTAFNEDWTLPTSKPFVLYSNPNHGRPIGGYADSGARDGRSLRLLLNPNPPAGVSGAPAVETKLRYLYGDYWSRVKTANCSAQPKAGVVTGIFTYFNNGSDLNGNGLTDNAELDFEWLCAKPEVVHLSIWTDYLESNPAQLRVTYRTINIKSGKILMECFRTRFRECQTLSNAERQPRTLTAIPNYDPVNKYYDYGILFEANRIQFVMVADGKTLTLWDYRGPSTRIPHEPMHFMHNVWHTNNWYPQDDSGTAIEAPRSQVNAYVDFSSFTPKSK